MRIIPKVAKTIHTKTKISGLDYTINQYVGCEHQCIYCYAKFIMKWKNYGDWGTWVEVKVNAPELVKKYVKGYVSMSTVSDPYQPIEKELKLTRRILQNMNKGTKLSILTKSDLVLRDIDVIKNFENIKIGLTINGFPENIRNVLEPGAPSHEQRVKALRKIKQEGINTYCFMSPVIPLLTDIERVLKDTNGIPQYYVIEFINMGLAGQRFRDVLKRISPDSLNIIEDNRRMANFILEIKKMIQERNIPVSDIITHQKKKYCD